MIWRRVVKVTYSPRCDCLRLGQRARVELECGHVKECSAAAAPRKRTTCEQCAAAAAGTGLTLVT